MKLLVLLPLLLWSQFTIPRRGGPLAAAVPNPFSLVQAVGDDAGTLTVAATAAGNLYVACYGEVGTATVSVADNATGGSNTYVARSSATATHTSNGFTTGCLDVLGAAHAGATSITFTFTGTSGYTAIWFYEFHRTSGTWAFDNGVAANNATATGTNVAGPSITLAGGVAVTASLVNDQIAVGGNPTSGNAFNAGGVLTTDGNGSISLISASGGTFASAQTDQISGDTYCASAVAYK